MKLNNVFTNILEDVKLYEMFENGEYKKNALSIEIEKKYNSYFNNKLADKISVFLSEIVDDADVAIEKIKEVDKIINGIGITKEETKSNNFKTKITSYFNISNFSSIGEVKKEIVKKLFPIFKETKSKEMSRQKIESELYSIFVSEFYRIVSNDSRRLYSKENGFSSLFYKTEKKSSKEDIYIYFINKRNKTNTKAIDFLSYLYSTDNFFEIDKNIKSVKLLLKKSNIKLDNLKRGIIKFLKIEGIDITADNIERIIGSNFLEKIKKMKNKGGIANTYNISFSSLFEYFAIALCDAFSETSNYTSNKKIDFIKETLLKEFNYSDSSFNELEKILDSGELSELPKRFVPSREFMLDYCQKKYGNKFSGNFSSQEFSTIYWLERNKEIEERFGKENGHLRIGFNDSIEMNDGNGLKSIRGKDLDSDISITSKDGKKIYILVDGPRHYSNWSNPNQVISTLQNERKKSSSISDTSKIEQLNKLIKKIEKEIEYDVRNYKIKAKAITNLLLIAKPQIKNGKEVSSLDNEREKILTKYGILKEITRKKILNYLKENYDKNKDLILRRESIKVVSRLVSIATLQNDFIRISSLEKENRAFYSIRVSNEFITNKTFFNREIKRIVNLIDIDNKETTLGTNSLRLKYKILQILITNILIIAKGKGNDFFEKFANSNQKKLINIKRDNHTKAAGKQKIIDSMFYEIVKKVEAERFYENVSFEKVFKLLNIENL